MKILIIQEAKKEKKNMRKKTMKNQLGSKTLDVNTSKNISKKIDMEIKEMLFIIEFSF